MALGEEEASPILRGIVMHSANCVNQTRDWRNVEPQGKPSICRQPVGNVLAGKGSPANGNDDVLPAVEHVRHRRTALRRWHVDGTDFVAGRFVVGVKQSAGSVRGNRGGHGIAANHQRLCDERARVQAWPVRGIVSPLSAGLLRTASGVSPCADLPHEFACVQIDRGDRSIGRLDQRQSLYGHPLPLLTWPVHDQSIMSEVPGLG